jgi:hypothetical protein
MTRLAAVFLAAIVATLPAVGCNWPGLWDRNNGNGNTQTTLYGVYFSPATAYPDADLWVVLNYSGRMDAARVRWFLNGAQIASLANLTRMPAGTAKAGDSVSVRARIIFGNDSTSEVVGSTTVQPIPMMSVSAPIVGYLDLKGVAGRSVVLSGWASPYVGGAAVADTVTTDANGNAAFTIDARIVPPITVTVDGGTAWYGVSRISGIRYSWDSLSHNYAQTLDTVRMIPKLVDANNVDQLDYCRKVTGTDVASGGTAMLVNWGKPLLRVFLNRAAAPTAGLADSAWQAFERWNVARGIPLFVETPVEANNSEVVVAYEQRTGPLTTLTSTTTYPPKLIMATVHVPLSSQPDTAFLRAMVHEAGHAQGFSKDFSTASYVMSLGGGSTLPRAVEVGCSLMFSSLPVGHDMSQYR